MGVRVLLGRPAVRRPARVPDPIGAVERVKPYALFKISELPFRTPELQMPAFVRDGDPRRIVPAVLQLPQPVDDQRHHLLVPYVTYNSAHN